MNDIEQAVMVFNQGGIVIFPTDTAYGIGCRIDNAKAVQRLFAASIVETVRPDDPRPLTEAASSQELLFSAVRRRGLPQKYEFLSGRWKV